MTVAETMRAVRFVRRARSGGYSPGNTAYAVYIAVMLTALVLAPLLRLAVVGMAQPAVLAVLQAPGASVVTGAAIGLFFAGMALLGRVRGPVLLSPFLTVAIAGNPFPRRQTLRRSFLVSAVILIALVTGAGVIVAAVLATAGYATWASAIAFLAGLLLSCALAAVAWLAGQVLPTRRASLLAGAITLVTVATTLAPGAEIIAPWGWVSLLYPAGAVPAWAPLGALLALAVLAFVCVGPLLDRLSGAAMLAQARRWQLVGIFGATGDLASALAQFRALPQTGRTWSAVRGNHLAVTFLIRDLIGSLRTPARFVAAAVTLGGAGFLMAIAIAAAPSVMWLPTLTGSILCYLALGVWSDGFRHAIEAAAAAPLYGVRSGRLLLLHSILPVLCVLVFAGAGAVVSTASGAPVLGVFAAITISLFAVTMRIFDSAKGPMPLALLAPVPTPLGDFSGLLVLYWQADAVIITGMVATALTLAAASAAIWLSLFLPAAAVMLVLTRRRLARL